MSVVVKQLKSSSMEIYVKGAPEVMSEICNPDTCTYVLFRSASSMLILRQSLRTMVTSYRTTLSAGTE